MSDQMILTPFFLDKPEPGLLPLAQSEWRINQPDALPGDDQQQQMAALHQPLADLAATAARQGKRPVSIAGDCCATIGFLAGLQRAGVQPTLIWLDAHGDFNTWETTPSGFLGGMPLAMLVGRGEQRMPAAVGLTSLPENQVILSDARDLDPGEKIAVDSSAMTHWPDAAQLLDAPLPDGPLYVHFDVDILNPADAPAMNYLAAGGPRVSLMRRIFQRLAQTERVTAVSLSAWNPEMEGAKESKAAVMELLTELLR